MLNTLRKLNEGQEKRPSINEGYEVPDHLMDKKTYDVDVENQGSSEGEQSPQQNQESNIVVINDVDVKLASPDSMDMKLTDEQKTAISGIIDNFRQQVSQTANLEPGFTMTPSQIRLDGEISDFDLHFTFVAGEQTGLYFTSDMTEVTPEFVSILNGFSRFDKMFRDAMEPLITQRQNN
jgi:hypothetical protein